MQLSIPDVLKRFYLLISREREREGEREGENHQCAVVSVRTELKSWPATQACALTGNRTSVPLVQRPPLNPLSHHQPGQVKKS